MTSPTTIEAKAKEIADRLERLAGDRLTVLAEIDGLVLQDQPINGQLRKRDEIDVKRAAWEREMRRLLEEELPDARRREAEAQRKKRLEAARKHQAAMVRAAGEVDAALAKATGALAKLRAAEAEAAEELRAAGEGVPRLDWAKIMTRALWGSRGVDGRWNRWRGTAETETPLLATLLGLQTELRRHGLPLAEQLRKLGPQSDEDPLEIRPPAEVPENKRLPVGLGPDHPDVRARADEALRVAGIVFTERLVDNPTVVVAGQHMPDDRMLRESAARRAASEEKSRRLKP